jgi:hypothetical protein
MVDIRLCGRHDVDALTEFINQHWRRGHVLTVSRALLDWQHFDTARHGYNFVLASRDSELLGILGFIPSRQYDQTLASCSTLWLALWKVREDANVAGLGLRMLQFLLRTEPHFSVGVIGIGRDAQLPMYHALGFETGELTQYVLFSPAAPRRLSIIPEGWRLPVPSTGYGSFVPLNCNNIEAAVSKIQNVGFEPTKSGQYFRNRFFGHPLYEYTVHLVHVSERPVGLLASRVAEHDGSRALRLVDYWGDPDYLTTCGSAIQALLESSGAEYADLWCCGVKPGLLEQAGFRAVDPEGPLVVPSHFEPFLRKNTRLSYAMRSSRPFRLFRADGDQDRPGQLRIAKEAPQ